MAKPKAPAGLRAGGRALWSALASDPMPEHIVALLTEACRARDRLDQLDRVLRGDADSWMRLTVDVNSDGSTYVLRISAALAQANTTAATLRALLDKIPAPKAAAPPAAGGGTGLDQLAARREIKQADPARGAARKSTRTRTAERRRPSK